MLFVNIACHNTFTVFFANNQVVIMSTIWRDNMECDVSDTKCNAWCNMPPVVIKNPFSGFLSQDSETRLVPHILSVSGDS